MSEVTTGELARRLDRIERKLDVILSDHEDRIRKAERWVYGSAAVAATGLVTGLGSLLGGGL